jgi:3-oxoacyl-[acyl-carrier-protein] synthase II
MSVRQVVITGMGLISPLGNDLEQFWSDMIGGRSGVRRLKQIPGEVLGAEFGAEAQEFSGEIESFGELEVALRRSIKKNLKVMCREIQMGVAAAQHALTQAKLDVASRDVDRTGVVYGSDYIMTGPQEFIKAMALCCDDGEFQFDQWPGTGLPRVDPLWLLKYLPNMPASHIAINNDLRGPNNSLTMREASANLAIAEAAMTIQRGQADVMLAGATGTRVHSVRSIHVAMQEPLAGTGKKRAAEELSRPFDHDHDGQVVGEGAATIVLESREHAENRGATIYGEIAGFGSSCVFRDGRVDIETAMANAMNQAIGRSGSKAKEIGHIHAHGLSAVASDRAEAAAIRGVFSEEHPPVTAAKSQLGNVGAAGGMLEVIVSLLAMADGRLPAVLNYETPDKVSPLKVNTDPGTAAGDSFVSVSSTPIGQASAVLVRQI